MRLLERVFGRLVPDRENGAVLIIVASSLLVIMGMAAFAVDYGWIYFSQLNARKAAEAAALAGVANMPLPDCAPPVSGTEPYDTALDIAARNGYSATNGDTATPVMGSTCARLQVTVQRQIPTFFMKAFGINTFSVSESATAEHLPTLKMGSDESFLGEDPDNPTSENRNVNFYLAVNGDRTNKAQGDAYTSENLGDYNTASQGPNPEYRSPSYWYALDVPAAHSGQTVTLQIFDPQLSPSNSPRAGDLILNNPNSNWQDPSNSQTRFRVLAPDDTPSDWTDNSTVISGCDDTYREETHGSYNSSWEDTWVSACTISNAQQGIYVIEVTQSGDVDILNAFSFRALVDGSASNSVAIYGLGAMSLWNSEAGSAAQFKVVKLDDVYAGSRLVVQLWDVGDINGTGSLEFKGSLASIECQIRERNDVGTVTSDWGPDDGNQLDGSVGCFENINPEREYNNEWIDFAFDIPADFTCTGDACWATVKYNLPGTPHDRTTWSAFIDGQPIHLIP